jgi:hypothetical protein
MTAHLDYAQRLIRAPASMSEVRCCSGVHWTYPAHFSLRNAITESRPALEVLESLPLIRILSLSGNPVAGSSSLRQLLVCCVPRLTMLDGEAVSAEEKVRAALYTNRDKALTGTIDGVSGNGIVDEGGADDSMSDAGDSHAIVTAAA